MGGGVLCRSPIPLGGLLLCDLQGMDLRLEARGPFWPPTASALGTGGEEESREPVICGQDLARKPPVEKR